MAVTAFTNYRRFDVPCRLEDLPAVIDLAVRLSGHLDMFTRDCHNVRPAVQISPDWTCLAMAAGTMEPGETRPGLPVRGPFTDLPFRYSAGRLAQYISEWIRTLPRLGRAGNGICANGLTGVRVRSFYSFRQDEPDARRLVHNGSDGVDTEDPFLVFEPYLI